MGKRNFRLAPPDAINVRVFDRSRDLNGNPTARYLLTWSNGKTGADWDGGSHQSARRVQVGYRDKASGGAIGIAADIFPGAVFNLQPGSLSSDFYGNATLTLERDPEAERVPVIFRAERSGDFRGAVTAVFPTVPGTDDSDVMVYAHIGQHGSGTRGWYSGTRAATDAEAEPLRRELESIGYNLETVKRWTRSHDDKRRAVFAAMREE